MSQRNFTLIRNADVWAPSPLGLQDVFVSGERIIEVGTGLTEKYAGLVDDTTVIDASGKYLVPGFIDEHVHIAGGGGAAGHGSRGPEITFSECMLAGTTTAIGCLGIDTVTRSPIDMVAKARSLYFRGMSSYLFTGGFNIPPTLITDSIKKDMWLVPEIIGVGEAAVSDFRARHQTPRELAQLFTDVLIAGRMTGKAGAVHLHLGGGAEGLTPVLEAVELGGIPTQYVLPTHFNRTAKLMSQAPEWAGLGGFVDVSSNLEPEFYPGSVQAAESVKHLLDSGVPAEQITISTDGNGVHTLYGYETAHRFPLDMLHRDFVLMVRRHGIPLEVALATITANVAKATALSHKGRIEVGRDADILLLEKDSLAIDTVLARGIVHVEGGAFIQRHSFDV